MAWDSAAFDRWLTTDPENQPEIPAEDSPAVSVSQCDIDESCQYDPLCPFFAGACRRDARS